MAMTYNFCAAGPALQPLSWSLRLKIAIGAARGLAFLHNSEKQIIYRDFKASNILLDSVFFFAMPPKRSKHSSQEVLN